MREIPKAFQSRLWSGSLELLALWTFAVTQPLLDLLARNPTFLVFHRATPVDVISTLLVLSLGMPLLLLALEALVNRISSRLREGAHGAVAFALLAALALSLIRRLPLVSDRGVVLGALVFAALATWAYTRVATVRLYLSFLSPAVLVCAALFLFQPSIRGLISPAEPAATPAPSRPPVGTRVPVVFVIFDELPLISLLNEAYQIDSKLYPNFAELARQTTWFRNATTTHQETDGAVPTLLTGRWVRDVPAPTLANYPENLFTLLAASHELNVFESVTHLAPTGVTIDPSPASSLSALLADLGLIYLHLILPDEYAAGLPSVSESWGGFWRGTKARSPPTGDTVVWSQEGALRDERAARFQRFLDSLVHRQRPGLFYAHVMLPHTPWRYLPSGRVYGARYRVGRLPGQLWLDDEWYVFQGYQRHLLQLAYVDSLLGRLLERLREAGLWDGCALVVTSDHGSSFWPGEERRDAFKLSHPQDVLRVPLFVKAPGQRRGEVNDRNVEAIDVLPTLAHLLDIDLPWSVDGQVAVDSALPERREKQLHNRQGRPRVFPASAPEERASLERKLALFDSQGREHWYGFGSYGGLVGQEIEATPRLSAPHLELDLDQRSILAGIDPASPFLPVLLSGRMRGRGLGAPLPLAVAVNGRIEAVGQTFAPRDEVAEFFVMIPESALGQGANRVEILGIQGSADRPILIRPRSGGPDDESDAAGPDHQPARDSPEPAP